MSTYVKPAVVKTYTASPVIQSGGGAKASGYPDGNPIQSTSPAYEADE